MFTTPASLLQKLRERPAPEVWDRLVELYSPLLFSWAKRLLHDGNERADLVQEVFTTLVGALPRFRYDAGGSFRAWLKTILLNAWRKQRQRLARVRRITDEALDEIPDTDPRLELEEAEYRRHLVARALALIEGDFEPATWRAFCRYVIDAVPPDAVARELGISANAVYLAKSRVLRHLRAELAGLLD